jgi:hypothetical protein
MVYGEARRVAMREAMEINETDVALDHKVAVDSKLLGDPGNATRRFQTVSELRVEVARQCGAVRRSHPQFPLMRGAVRQA